MSIETPARASLDALSSKMSSWVPSLVLMILTVVAFSGGLTGGFVLDDDYAIARNPVVQGDAPLIDAFKLTFWGRPLDTYPPTYRPLVTLTFAADHLLGGNSGVLFHVSSLLWYLGLVLAAWSLARRCIGDLPGWVAIALFSVMPTHVETVSSLVGRADTMGVLAAVLSLIAIFPKSLTGMSVSRLLLATLSFGAALLCKENMVIFPVVVALLIEFRRRRHTPLPLLKAHLPSLTMLVVLGVYAVLRLHFQPGLLTGEAPDDVLDGASVLERIGYGLELLARYAGLVAIPVNLCTGRKFAEVYRPEHLSMMMVMGAIVLAATMYSSWRDYQERRFPFSLVALASLFVVSGVVLAMPESMADRYILFSSLFLCLAIAPPLLSFVRTVKPGWAVLPAILFVQLILSQRQSRTWHDDRSLLSHAVDACPDSVHNHFRYAEYLANHGESAEAVWHYAVVTKGRHAFPYAWSHPAKEEERSMPIAERLQKMHALLGFNIDEASWRTRFEQFLISIGRVTEANLVASIGPQP